MNIVKGITVIYLYISMILNNVEISAKYYDGHNLGRSLALRHYITNKKKLLLTRSASNYGNFLVIDIDFL